MDEKDRIIRNGAVYAEGTEIIEVGESQALSRRHADTEIDAHDGIIIPGFINAHTHLAASLVKGLGADVPILEWLKQLKWPYYLQINQEELHHAALLGCIENIRAGCTTVVDHYYPPRGRSSNVDSIGEAFKQTGVRGVLIRAYHDRSGSSPEEFIVDAKRIIREYDRIISTWNGKADGRIMTWTSPDNILYCTEESVRGVAELAKKKGVGMHTHLSESPSMAELVKKLYGKGSIEMFEELGSLWEKFQAAHAIILSDREIQLMAGRHASAVNNPITNTYIADGVAPVPQMLREGVNVALGTDATGTYGCHDFFYAMKLCAAIHKVHSMDTKAIDARTVLKMATLNGAKSLGLADRLGSLEPGKLADITVVGAKKPHMVPLLDPVAALVYSATSADVETVVVNGKVVMQNRVVRTLNEETILHKARDSAEQLVARSGLIKPDGS
jgi:5-methylthioadenosine/S-adenosylhomocysteine deaminase